MIQRKRLSKNEFFIFKKPQFKYQQYQNLNINSLK
jgi:hypothetical protein